MTDSTEHTTLPKSTESKNGDSSIQIQVKPNCQFAFVLRDTEESKILDPEDFCGVQGGEDM